jgi:hypothetical protein
MAAQALMRRHNSETGQPNWRSLTDAGESATCRISSSCVSVPEAWPGGGRSGVAWDADSARRSKPDGYQCGCGSRPDRGLLASVFHPPSPIDPSQGMRARLLVCTASLRRIGVESTARYEPKAGQAVMSQER